MLPVCASMGIFRQLSLSQCTYVYVILAQRVKQPEVLLIHWDPISRALLRNSGQRYKSPFPSTGTWGAILRLSSQARKRPGCLWVGFWQVFRGFMLWTLVNLSCICRQLIQIVANRARNFILCSPDLLHRLGLIFAFPVGICSNGAAINCRRESANQPEGSASVRRPSRKPGEAHHRLRSGHDGFWKTWTGPAHGLQAQDGKTSDTPD